MERMNNLLTIIFILYIYFIFWFLKQYEDVYQRFKVLGSWGIVVFVLFGFDALLKQDMLNLMFVGILYSFFVGIVIIVSSLDIMFKE